MDKKGVINKYNNLVYKMVHQYRHLADADDLYQSGMLGLLKATEKFDASRGFDFMTYAYNFIKGEMCKTIQKCQHNLLTGDYYKLKTKLDQVTNLLTHKLGRTPSVQEIALATDIDEVKIADIIGANQNLLSLDMPYQDIGPISEVISDMQANINPDNIDLYNAIHKLNMDDQLIIYQKYFEGRTQTEIASMLGINQVAVSRRENKIMQRMRTSLIN